MDWQPIETAPTDRTAVIVAVPRLGTAALVGEAYFDDGWWWANTDYGDYVSGKITDLHSAPSHWQPLPEPPAPIVEERIPEGLEKP